MTDTSVPAQQPQPPQKVAELPPITTLLGTCRRARTAHIVELAGRMKALLATLEPGQYRTSDLVAALNADAVGRLHQADTDALSVTGCALFLGHETAVVAGEERVTRLPDKVVRDRDLFLFGRICSVVSSEPGRLPAPVRELQRSVRVGWVTAWGIRGTLTRMVEEGRVAVGADWLLLEIKRAL
jgi:hypothetical protein